MTLNITQSGSTVIIEMDDQERRNAIDAKGAAELTSVIRRETSRPGHRGMVLTGKGAFCAGGDLPSVLQLVGGPEEALRDVIGGVYQGLIRAILDAPVPVVAAIDGPAIGLGLDLAVACDARFIGKDGWLMQGWAAVGLIPAAGSLAFLLERVPRATIWRWVSGQPRITGEMAQELGLASFREDLTGREAALEFVDSLNGLPTETVSAYLELMRRSWRSQIDDYLAACLDLQIPLLRSTDFADRVAKRFGS